MIGSHIETVDRGRDGGTRMKGFVIVSVLAAVIFALKWLYARRAAKTDPVDAKALQKTSFPRSSGH